MKKPELVAAIAEQTGLTKEKSAEILNIVTDEITNAMVKNDPISLIGFGSFSVRSRSARTGKNPQTGKAIQIAASKTVGFKPGKALKDAVN
jgi:DNA-binding protein HU-alpha